jgi:hypothetical protein
MTDAPDTTASTDFITPSFGEEDLYGGKEFEQTPPGSYKMVVNNLSVRKTKKGLKYLSVFLIHAEEDAKKRFNGVNGLCMLEGNDKNGKPLARQFGDFMTALGYDKVANKASYALLGDLDAADWKGVGVTIAVSGEPVDLIGKEVLVRVTADTYEGKTKTRANSFYRIS